MKELFEKVVIESERDLPKEPGFYLCHIIDDDEIKQWSIRPDRECYEEDKADWLRNIDWYLKPVHPFPVQEVTDFEIEAKFPILSSHQMDTESWNNRLRQEGAKWCRSRLREMKGGKNE